MSYKLNKPYSEKQRIDFVVRYNHVQNLEIFETDNAIYALEKWETLDGDTVIDNTEEYNQQLVLAEKERIARLSLTRGDVFRGLLLAKGIMRSQIRSLLESLPESTPEELIIKELALIDYDEALNFYRGKEIIDAIGLQLGITSEQLDKFFETNDYTYLLDQVTPEDEVIPEEEITTEEEEPEDVVPENEVIIEKEDIQDENKVDTTEN